MPAEFAFPIPSGVSTEDAAAIPVNYLTALIALYRMANLESGDTVLIHGAGGGVGIAATQLARLRGATIVGTASASKHAGDSRSRACSTRSTTAPPMCRPKYSG